MINVNNITFKRIFSRSLISLIFCILTLIITRRIGDTDLYLGRLENASDFAGERTILTLRIFSYLPQFGSVIVNIIFLIIISTTIIYFLINRFIDKENSKYWNLILYLPCLLIYSTTPSKEFVFFIPALIYIIIESDLLISKSNKFNLIKNIIKIILLIFMYSIRGILSYPYLALAIIIFLSKIISLNIFKVKNLNFSTLLLSSFLISLFLITFLTIQDPDIIVKNLNSLNVVFSKRSILSRSFDSYLINNIYNPVNYLNIQILSFFPSLNEILLKPHTLVIVYDSIIFNYLYFNLWNNLFLVIKKDNFAKSIFGIIFILITCSYLLIYGIVGYSNIGSSQRFKTNFIPISLIFPLIIHKKIVALN